MLLVKQKWQDELIHTIGLLTMKEDRVIKQIVYHPLEFAREKMTSEDDERPIRIRYFGAFVLKSKRSKERARKFTYIYKNYEVYKDIVASYGYEVDTLEKYQVVLKQHFNGKKIRYIDEIYEKGLVLKQCI